METKNVLIIEKNINSPLVRENVDNSPKKYLMGGTFTEFGIRNRNERVYNAKKFLPALNELQDRIKTFEAVYGEFDHPDIFDTSMKNASHVIKEAYYVPEKNAVHGKIQLLPIKWGREARRIVDDGLPLFVSSRAAGITESDGSVTIKKLFTYDIVADPGFASARMENINESCGYSPDANFRIFEMKDETKINELFKMNKNDLVTKTQLTDYSDYLLKELNSTRKIVDESIKEGALDSKKMESLLSYYENLNENYAKLTRYLDYLAETIQIVVNENKDLKDTTVKLTENIDKTIRYTEYLAENVDLSIQYSEYVAENAEHIIEYADYIAENLDKTIEHNDYIVENMNNVIEYTEYIAENVDSNIAYSEYLAEHLDDGLAYTDYIAEQLDNSLIYNKMIAEKLNESTSKIFENLSDEENFTFPYPEDSGFEVIEDDEEEEQPLESDIVDDEVDEIIPDDETEIGEEDDNGENCRVVCDGDEESTDETDIEAEIEAEIEADAEVLGDEEGTIEDTPDIETETVEEEENEVLGESVNNADEDCEDCENETEEESDEECENCDEPTVEQQSITSQIDQLIIEAKKRKASETAEHNFLRFLNKGQIDSFYNLTNEEQENVVSYVNEKGNYFTNSDVVNLINEAVADFKTESLEERLERLMPESVKEVWGHMHESTKVSIISQAKLFPNLKSDEQIEHFWLTRRLPKVTESTKTLMDKEDRLIQEDTLSDETVNKIMEKFRQIG